MTSRKNCLNFPLAPGTQEEEYLITLTNALEKVKEFNPEIIGISAGFDTYKGDPITNLNLEIDTYEKISKLIHSLNKSCFAILEGGYSVDTALCIYSFLAGF